MRVLADIIPLRRLPSSLEFFTYQIPDELESVIRIGHLVSIPFRNSFVLGVVLSLESITTPSPKIKSIASIFGDTPIVSEEFLAFARRISAIYGVATSVILEMSLPNLTKTILPKLIFKPHAQTRSQRAPASSFFHYTTVLQHKKILLSKISSTGQTLILVPEKKYLEEIASFFDRSKIVIFQSELGTKQKRDAWLSIRNGKCNIILGTRGALFLPFFDLQSVILDYEHHQEHKQSEQMPRYSTKDVISVLQNFKKFHLTFASFSPSLQTYHSIYKENLLAPNVSSPLVMTHKKLPIIVNMQDERRGGNTMILAEKVQQQILDSRGDVYIFVNRKGFASSVKCFHCGHTEKCQSCSLPLVFHQKENNLQCHYCKSVLPMISECALCHKNEIKFFGTGVETVEKEIQIIVANKKNHQICIIDSEHQPPQLDKNTSYIFIGTEMTTKFLHKEKTDVIAFIDIDRQISMPEFTALESAWHSIFEMQYFRHEKSSFFIQTLQPKHFLFRSLYEPDRFYRTELGIRLGLYYPPYSFLLRYFYGNSSLQLAKKEVETTENQLQEELTKLNIQGTITGPFEMQPCPYRGKYWYGILIKMNKNTWMEDIDKINILFKEGWKIDPNPLTLLHP